MACMTDEMIEACYQGGVMLSNGETLLHRERDRIANKTGMNRSSASYYLSAVDALLSNGDITRDINSTALDNYLRKIARDYGKEALIIAASVCFRRYEETKRLGNTCHYYKAIAEKHLGALSDNE